MKQAVLSLLLLLALALSASACSLKSALPSTTLLSATPTPLPTPQPTQPPVDQSSIDSFDNNAGNCVDAANQAISLIQQAAAGHFGNSFFNMDMSLELEPHDPNSGCADSAHIAHYRQDVVYKAALTVWPLDYVWSNAGPTIRQQWLADVLNTLVKLYPRANSSIQVMYNGLPCGSAAIGTGKSGTPQIDTSCV